LFKAQKRDLVCSNAQLGTRVDVPVPAPTADTFSDFLVYCKDWFLLGFVGFFNLAEIDAVDAGLRGFLRFES